MSSTAQAITIAAAPHPAEAARRLIIAPTTETREMITDPAPRIIAASTIHNIRFDREFLAAELSSSGVFLPAIPCLCTLALAYRLHPDLPNHRIGTCCEAAGLEAAHVHDALSEARATAHLLKHYLAEATSAALGLADVLDGELAFRKPWPTFPESGRTVARHILDETESASDASFLSRVTSARVGSGSTEGAAMYLDVLDRALLDGIMSDDEAFALDQTVRDWGLSDEEVRVAHETYLRSLVRAALADGWITTKERVDLLKVSALLRLEPSGLDALINDVAENVD